MANLTTDRYWAEIHKLTSVFYLKGNKRDAVDFVLIVNLLLDNKIISKECAHEIFAQLKIGESELAFNIIIAASASKF